MLACDIEVMQREQKIVPPFVRLETFDDLSLDLRQPLFSFTRRQWVDVVKEGRVNGKVMLGVRRFAVASSEGSCKQVETCSGTINGSPDSSIQRERQSPIDLQLKELLSRLRVVAGTISAAELAV